MPRRLFSRVLFFLVILIAVFSAAVFLFAKPILLSIAEKELQKIFKQSSISGLNIAINFIEFQGIEIKEKNSYDLKIKEARIYYSLRSLLKNKTEKIEAFKLNISSFKTDLFEIKGILLSAARDRDDGEFSIKSVNYNKLKIGDISGKSELKGNMLYIRPVLFNFIGGSVKGEFDISLDQGMDYNLRLDGQGMEIKRLVDDMEYNEKFNMTGRLDGELYISGNDAGIKDIKGDFYTEAAGGVLVIKDKTFLENIAKQSNQPLNIIMESFNNYNYNNGIVKLSADTGNLVMDLKLEGSSGKRSLSVILHDFNKGKEKQ